MLPYTDGSICSKRRSDLRRWFFLVLVTVFIAFPCASLFFGEEARAQTEPLGSEPVSAPVPKPTPAPVPEPIPEPAPAPTPEPILAPEPAPVEPTPAEPVLVEPVPIDPAPEPVPVDPAPELAPVESVPDPAPASEPTPRNPTPETIPIFEPSVPAPTSKPMARSIPALVAGSAESELSDSEPVDSEPAAAGSAPFALKVLTAGLSQLLGVLLGEDEAPNSEDTPSASTVFKNLASGLQQSAEGLLSGAGRPIPIDELPPAPAAPVPAAPAPVPVPTATSFPGNSLSESSGLSGSDLELLVGILTPFSLVLRNGRFSLPSHELPAPSSALRQTIERPV